MNSLSASTSYGNAGALSSALAAMPSSQSVQPLSSPCSVCKKALKDAQVLKCSRCLSVIYCGQVCQKKDWKNHKPTCTLQQPNAATAAVSRRRFLSLEDVNCFDNEGFRGSLSEYKRKIENNVALLPQFAHFKSPEYNHPEKTKEFILEGCAHLDPEKSVVVVCGAQGHENQFVEPLDIILHKCKRLILVDIDEITLSQLKAHLDSQKVTTMKMDLSFASKLLQSFMDEVGQNNWKPIEFYEKVVQFFTQLIEHVTRAGISFPLEQDESIDFIISSLTASQLAMKVKLCVYLMIQERFHISAVDFISGLGNQKREVLQKLSLELNAVMIKRHVSQLFACAGKHGNVYLADVVMLDGMEEPLISPDILLDLEQTFGQENWQERNWHWVQDPEHVYSIQAFLRIGEVENLSFSRLTAGR